MTRPPVPALCLLLVAILAPKCLGAGNEIAHGRPATASKSFLSSLPDSAFDGDTATAWNSGDHAIQWIEVDLGTEWPITEVQGCADITPNGQVTIVVEGRTASGSWYSLGGYAGPSERNQWLAIPCVSAAHVRYVRVTTTSSPSWIAWFEIRAYSDQPVRASRSTWGGIKSRFLVPRL